MEPELLKANYKLIKYNISKREPRKEFKKYNSDDDILKDFNNILNRYSKDIFKDDTEYFELKDFDEFNELIKNKTLKSKGNLLKIFVDYIISLKGKFHILHIFDKSNLDSLDDFLKIYVSYKDIENYYSNNTNILEDIFKKIHSNTKNKDFLKLILKTFAKGDYGNILVNKGVLNIIIENEKVQINTFQQENMVCLYLTFLAEKKPKIESEQYYEFMAYLKEKKESGYVFNNFFTKKNTLKSLIDDIILSYIFNFDWLKSCVMVATKIRKSILSGLSLDDYYYFDYNYLNNFLSDNIEKNHNALSLWHIMKKHFKNSLSFDRNKWCSADIVIVKNTKKDYLIQKLTELKTEIENLSKQNIKFTQSRINGYHIKKIQKEISDNEKKIVNIISHKINNNFVEFFDNKDLFLVSLKKNTNINPPTKYVNFFNDTNQKHIDKFIAKISSLNIINKLEEFVEIKDVKFGSTITFEFNYSPTTKEKYDFTTSKSSKYFSTKITIDKKNSEARYGSASIKTIDTNIFEELKNELKSLILLRIKCLKKVIAEYNKTKDKNVSLNRLTRQSVISSKVKVSEKNKEFHINRLSSYLSSRTIFLTEIDNNNIAKEFLNSLKKLIYKKTDVLTEFCKLYFKELGFHGTNIKKGDSIQNIYNKIQSIEFSYLFDKHQNKIKSYIKKLLVVEIYSFISSRGLFNTILTESNLKVNIAFRGCPFILVG